jgi:hypothetical protein
MVGIPEVLKPLISKPAIRQDLETIWSSCHFHNLLLQWPGKLLTSELEDSVPIIPKSDFGHEPESVSFLRRNAYIASDLPVGLR